VTRVAPFVDGVGVMLWLLENGLPPLREPLGLTTANVFEDLPDELATVLPLVKIQRTGGASDRPRFHSQFWLPVNVWSDAEDADDDSGRPAWDARQAAYELAKQVSTVIYEAWENQTVTPFGCINKWRESTGFRKSDDAELPHISRQIAVYDLRIRNQPAS
jgi:hypothetical protein